MTYLEDAAAELAKAREANEERAAKIPGLFERALYDLAEREERETRAERMRIAGDLIVLAAIEAGLPPARAADGWRRRCIDSEEGAIWHGQRILGVHALIARAQAKGSEAVSISDLLPMIGGPLPEPNSVTEWSKRAGGLGGLIEKLLASAGASRAVRTETP